jgi:diguanylate cyclase (GGDEF)-like protein
MLLNRFSMRFSMVVTIVAMGALAIALVLVTASIYREHAIENERAAMVEQIRIRLNDTRAHLENESRGLAMSLADHPRLRQTLAARDARSAGDLLAGMYGYTAVVNGEIRPIEVHLYDDQLKPIAGRLVGGSASQRPALCEHLREMAQRRQSAGRILSGNCLVEGRIYYSAILPLGQPVDGHVQIVVDLFKNLVDMESATGMPLRVFMTDGTLLYQSARWPGPNTVDRTLVAQYALNAYTDSKTYVVVAMARDENDFYATLEQTRNAVIGVAASVILLFVIVALGLLEKTAIAPLRALTDQLRLVREDESHLGKRVDVSGNAEVVELARDFNEMTTKLEELYGNLERMAFTDPLTQLPNRTLFHDRLQQSITAARREAKSFALFIMDLDRFKDINDTLGHHIGDRLLQQVALRLRGKLRESDTVARMGGDEFAILLPTVNGKHADMAARMLLQTLRAPFQIDDHDLDVGTSIGIALYPDHGIDAHTLTQRADVAMYAAKNAGCGHAFYDSRMDHHHPTRLALMSELRQAVEQEQFVLYYQPIVRLDTNRVTSVEALVRWRHPSGELMLPERFLPLLEQTGLVRSLTRWVAHEALRTAADLRARGFAIPIGINLSVRDLQDPYLAEEFAEHLAVHQASPAWLDLEVTESALLAEARTSLELLPRLSAMGFRIVIDDFGTGYSSLASLTKLPFAAIKVDRSFIAGLLRDENDATIVRTSIDLAHNLGLEVVAEGVDDGDALARLRSRACDCVQGIYVSRPLLADDLVEWLRKSTWGLSREAVGAS